MDALQLVLSKAGAVRKTGATYMAQCPAHDDGKASLAIRAGQTQPVLLTCHAGCERDTILNKWGLTWEAVCNPRDQPQKRGEWTPNGDAIAVYDYTDEDGKLLFQVLRTEGKRFSQRVPDPSRKSGWTWRLDGVRRVIYRLPKVINAIADGEVIYIAEGEKDVHALENAGVTATCNPGGAGKWRPEYTEVFRDALVCIVADKDKPGQAHARQVCASLAAVARAVEIAEAAAGKDATDHLASGKAVSELVVTRSGDEDSEPELAPDLHEFLAGEDPAEDWVIPHLLERGDRLIWTGVEGLGKTMVTRMIAICAAAGLHPFSGHLITPQRVLFIDCENPMRKSRRHFGELERIARIAKGRRVPDGGFRIIHRPEGIDLTREDAAWLLERVTAHRPDILFIGPIYRLHMTDTNEELAARAVVAALDAARIKVNCALVLEGHAPHSAEGRSRSLRPIGSSLFLRWPEFGYGIRPAGGTETMNATGHCTHVKVEPWRGPRDERRWPRELKWGEPKQDWPWVDPDARHLSSVPTVFDGEARP